MRGTRVKRESAAVVRDSVLLVEDDASAREALSELLRDDGFAVREAATLAEARAALAGEPVDAVLLDLRLPDGDGAALLEELAVRRGAPPTIVVTAYGSGSRADRGDARGRLRLRPEAARPGGADRDAARGDRARPAQRRAQLRQRRARRRRADRGQRPGHAARVQAGRAGRRERRHRARAGRERHRQGARRARAPRRQRARAGRSSRSTAPRSPSRCSRPSCSGTRRAPSPARSRPRAAASRPPTAARCSSTRSAELAPPSRPSCCACSRSGRSSGSAAAKPVASTCASSPRRTATWPTRSRAGASARTSSTGSRWSRSSCRRCASAPEDIPLLAERFARARRGATAGRPAIVPGRGRGARRVRPGPATCASWRTRSSGRWCSSGGAIDLEHVAAPDDEEARWRAYLARRERALLADEAALARSAAEAGVSPAFLARRRTRLDGTPFA